VNLQINLFKFRTI